MNDVVNLPKLAPPAHSATNGTLNRFHDNLSQRYLAVIASVRAAAQESSARTNLELKRRLSEYAAQRDEITGQQRAILESMGKKLVTFDELKSDLQALGARMIDLAVNLRRESVEVYDNGFQSLQPKIDEALKSCESYVAQLPANTMRGLEDEVEHLTKEYISAKQGLIQMLYRHELMARSAADDVLEEFVHRTDDWRENRFQTLVSAAKQKLDPQKPVDYGTIFEDFYKDQEKFTSCFSRVLQSVTLIAPPGQFDQSRLDDWWKEAEDIMVLHGHFLSQFKSKIQQVNDKRNEANEQLLISLEKELLELRNESEVMSEVSELYHLQKQGKRIAENYVSKLAKYWSDRTDAIRKSFEAIREFLQPLVELFTKCVTDAREHDRKVEEEATELRRMSDSAIQQCERELEQKTDEMQLLVAERDIKARVEACRGILNKMEEEYRSLYDKSIELFDVQPPIVLNAFEIVEKDMLERLKMKKVSSSPEWMSSSRTNKSQLDSMRRKPRPVSRASRQRGKKLKPEVEVEVFAFECENGSRFEEADKLEIIPVIEEFVDEASRLPTPVKGRARGRPPIARAKPRGKPTMRGQRGRGRIEEAEELDVPDIVLMDVVPKVNGRPSITVYTPSNDEIDEWKNSFRKQLILSLQTLFDKEIATASYEEKRQLLADELNERLRTHAPRINAIDLNIARTRVVQVESRKVQLEKHFRKTTLAFNKGLKQLETSIAHLNDGSMEDVNGLRSFVGDLEKQRNENSLELLNQEFGKESKKREKAFEAMAEQQTLEVTEFVSSYKMMSERFMKVVVDTDTVSAEERDMCMTFFERMDTQVAEISQILRERIEAIRTEFAKSMAKISEEFELLYPRHQNDVQFMDAIVAAHTEAKGKLDSLLFRSRQSENIVEETIRVLEDADREQSDPQTMIDRYFELLENARLAILKRAKYLNVLKSKLAIEPIHFNCDLAKELGDDERPVMEGSPVTSGRRPVKRTPIKMRPDSQPKNRTPKKREVEQSSVEVLGTLQGQVDNIGSEMIARLQQTMTDYYARLKQMKYAVTRPNDIPPNIIECTAKIRSKWRETTAGLPEFMEESARVLRSQIARSMEAARVTVEQVYCHFASFYTTFIGIKRDEMQQEFDMTLHDLTSERRSHRDALTTKAADTNNQEWLRQLLEDERARRQREATAVNDHNDAVYVSEGKAMTMFIEHIPIVTKTFLEMFDAFVLPEDMHNGEIENARRITLTEMIKERERMAVNVSNDPSRPFHQKVWPTIVSVMNPMQNVTLSTPAEPVVSPSTLATSGRRTPLKRSNGKKSPSSSSTTPPKMMFMPENLPSHTSLETALHRNVIIQRNQSYDAYEGSLGQRVESFKAYIQSLRDEDSVFLDHWKKCVMTLKHGSPVSPELL